MTKYRVVMLSRRGACDIAVGLESMEEAAKIALALYREQETSTGGNATFQAEAEEGGQSCR